MCVCVCFGYKVDYIFWIGIEKTEKIETQWKRRERVKMNNSLLMIIESLGSFSFWEKRKGIYLSFWVGKVSQNWWLHMHIPLKTCEKINLLVDVPWCILSFSVKLVLEFITQLAHQQFKVTLFILKNGRTREIYKFYSYQAY